MTERSVRPGLGPALACVLFLGLAGTAAAAASTTGDRPERDGSAVEEQDARLGPISLQQAAPATEAVKSSDLAPLASCPSTVLAGDGSTSGNGRAPMARYRGIRAVYLITAAELAASGLPNGSTPTAIGWRYSTAPGGVGASGTLTVYLQHVGHHEHEKQLLRRGDLRHDHRPQRRDHAPEHHRTV